MAVSASQESAFFNATFGLPMDAFQLTILTIFFALLYLWAGWVLYTQWTAWSNRKITLYMLLTRMVRCVLVTLFASFFINLM